MSILVVGSVAVDSIKTPFGKRSELLGGSATYFSLAARLFTKVNLIACIGNDLRISQLLPLRHKNIDLKGLKVLNGKTFRWSGKYFYDMDTRETTSLELNVFKDFKPDIPNGYAGSDIVFLANIDPDLQSDVLSKVYSPRFVACDTMDHWIKNKRKSLLKLLKCVNIFISNESEVRQLSNKPNLSKAANWILSKGPDVIVIKKGEHGACMITKKDIFFTPAYPLENIVDPTGAGDSFAGGFLGYLARSGGNRTQDLRKATVYGCAVASFCVESFGVTRLARISYQDIQRRVSELKRLCRL